MKKVYLIILLIAVAFNTVFSQVPNAFNYQAVVRSSTGQLLANQAVSFRVSLLKNSETGTVVYSETHALTTNEFGLVSFKIGEGTILSGSFSPVDWGEVIFIKVEFDPDGGSSYSHLATTKLSSVPFAIKAQSVVNDKVDDADADPANEIQTLSLSGTLLKLSNDGGSVTLPNKWEYYSGGIYCSKSIIVGLKVPHDGVKFAIQCDPSEDKYAFAASSNSRYATIAAVNSGDGLAGDFNGGVRIRDGSEGGGKVLTSDYEGNASWKTPASGGSSLWTQNGSNIYYNTGSVSTSNNLSIGNNLDVVNELTVGSITLSAGEIHKESTGSANMIPIAYGTINGNGTVLTSSGNITVTKAATGNYSIAINGETYSYGSYVTTATSVSLVGFIRTGSSGGKLMVLTYDTSAVVKDSYFSFIVYKP